MIAWTPLLVYLAPRWRSLDRSTAFGTWMLALIATDGISLVIDYVDIARYLLGDGALPQ